MTTYSLPPDVLWTNEDGRVTRWTRDVGHNYAAGNGRAMSLHALLLRNPVDEDPTPDPLAFAPLPWATDGHVVHDADGGVLFGVSGNGISCREDEVVAAHIVEAVNTLPDVLGEVRRALTSTDPAERTAATNALRDRIGERVTHPLPAQGPLLQQVFDDLEQVLALTDPVARFDSRVRQAHGLVCKVTAALGQLTR